MLVLKRRPGTPGRRFFRVPLASKGGRCFMASWLHGFMGDGRAPVGSVRHSDYAARMGLIMTVYPVSPAASRDDPQEVVVLSSLRVDRERRLVAVASRMWVTDLAGTGLERELMDPDRPRLTYP